MRTCDKVSDYGWLRTQVKRANLLLDLTVGDGDGTLPPAMAP
jgi:hypothetical protein